nr:hypothetical protein BHI3_07760 [Bacteriovorax sp. HI3]
MTDPQPYKLSEEQHKRLKKAAENVVHLGLRGAGSSIEKFDIVSRWMLAGSIFIVYNTLTGIKEIPTIYSPCSYKFLLAFQLLSIITGVIYIGFNEMWKSAREEVVPYLEKEVAEVVQSLSKEIEESGQNVSTATSEDLIFNELEALIKRFSNQKCFLIQVGAFVLSFGPIMIQFFFNL